MIATVTEDVKVLKPNTDHQNFTETDIIIPNGTEIEGKAIKVNGLRRGKPFIYRLFVTKNQEYIHLNKIKPMSTTQVYLSADAAQTPTVVQVPTGKNLITIPTIVGAVAGGYLGNYYAKTKGGSRQVMMIGGALLGYLIGYVYEQRKAVRFKPSK
jgi:uncharacterized protein YcfJ